MNSDLVMQSRSRSTASKKVKTSEEDSLEQEQLILKEAQELDRLLLEGSPSNSDEKKKDFLVETTPPNFEKALDLDLLSEEASESTAVERSKQ